jgi:hypothetical protein
MKIINIKGGLGNQMFQYAFYLSNLNSNDKVKVDISSYDSYNLHNGLEIEKIFNLKTLLNIANSSDLDHFKDKSKFFKIKELLGRLIKNNPNFFIKNTHFIEPNYSRYYKNFYNYVYLDGYWQNEKYFKDYKKQLIQNFKFKNISKCNNQLAKKISSENSISLHVRRFDKIKSLKDVFYRLKLFLLWRVASKNYYLKSIDKISKMVENPKFYVFSDDKDWVSKNLTINYDHVFVDWNRGANSYEDLFLMSQCKHNIISMSTFSWWSAWLNNNSNKIIISPKKWASKIKKDFGIIPSTWIRI